MHYEFAKEVWDNMWAIHEGESNIIREQVYSSSKHTCNVYFDTLNISKEETYSLSEDECGHETTSILTNRVTDSEEERLNNKFKLCILRLNKSEKILESFGFLQPTTFISKQ